jgi:hypothetical protein
VLGAILRLDVDGDDFPGDPGRNYAIPADNPFVGTLGEDEIWAYGLRNPFRSCFDRTTGDLYVADVGQGTWEEVNFQPASSRGGENYGWRLREGFEATPTGGVGGPLPGRTDPIHAYGHGNGDDQGFSITGGCVYRGPVSALAGKYFFADFVAARIWSIEHDGSGVTEHLDWTEAFAPPPGQGSIEAIVAFGEDAAGNLYIVDLGGDVFEVVESVGPTTSLTTSTTTTTVPATPTTSTTEPQTLTDLQEHLSAALPAPAGVAGKGKRVARKLARYYGRAQERIERAATAAGRNERRLYRRARARVKRLLEVARRAERAGRLPVPLPPIEEAAAALLERLSSG